jgi:hypothetical protein
MPKPQKSPSKDRSGRAINPIIGWLFELEDNSEETFSAIRPYKSN